MKKTLVLAILISGLLASCSSSKKEEFDSSIAVPDSLMPKPTVTTTTPAAATPQIVPAGMPQPVTAGSPGTVVPVTNGQAQTITPPVINSTLTAPVANGNAVATASGMNPAHGQPGHRCDIAVGAPLNSAKNPAAVVPQQNNVVTTSTPVPVKTAPGMNPPHGEPGHRCDITVGAPLNSKPAAPVTTPVVVPAKVDSATGARVGG